MKGRIRSGLRIALAVLAFMVCQPAGGESVREGRPAFDLQFHRGGRDARPENTLYAFQYAIEHGASTIECDMQMTRDGVIVLSHNPALNPDLTADAEGNRVGDGLFINRMTLSEVRAYNVARMDEASEYYRQHGLTQIAADAGIPTLRELFGLVLASGDGEIRINAEVKSYPDPALDARYDNASDTEAVVDEFYRLVKEFGFGERVILQSFDWSALTRMEAVDPSIETSALYIEEPWGTPESATLWTGRDEPSPWLGGADIRDFGGDPVRAAHALGLDCVSPYYREATAETVREAHEFGMRVIPWTVNDRGEMEALLESGVDGIITDRPWVLRALLKDRGIDVPAEKTVDLPWHLDGDHREDPPEKAR